MKEQSVSTTTKQSANRAIEIFSRIYGQHVWSVRCEDHGVLRLDFGAPHLLIRDPVALPLKSRDARPFIRRIALPTGHWHMFVEGGLWRVEAGGFACARGDETPECRAFAHLDGQKLISVAYTRAADEWQFDFDLGGRLSIKPQPPAPEPLSQWILFFEAGGCLYCDDGDQIFCEG